MTIARKTAHLTFFFNNKRVVAGFNDKGGFTTLFVAGVDYTGNDRLEKLVIEHCEKNNIDLRQRISEAFWELEAIVAPSKEVG